MDLKFCFSKGFHPLAFCLWFKFFEKGFVETTANILEHKASNDHEVFGAEIGHFFLINRTNYVFLLTHSSDLSVTIIWEQFA